MVPTGKIGPALRSDVSGLKKLAVMPGICGFVVPDGILVTHGSLAASHSSPQPDRPGIRGHRNPGPMDGNGVAVNLGTCYLKKPRNTDDDLCRRAMELIGEHNGQRVIGQPHRSANGTKVGRLFLDLNRLLLADPLR